MRPCWPWTGPSTPSRSCCCTRSPGRGSPRTAAEFARWYPPPAASTTPGTLSWAPGRCCGPASSITCLLDRLLDTAGDCFAALLEANGIHWQAITDPGARRDLVLQVLAQVPVLWVWDNVEPVTGFPPGTHSAWTQAEQDELAGFLRDLAQDRCKVLLTSRRDEHAWLGGLPARLALPPMPMRERLQLAAALAARHGQVPAGADWRPLLRYTAGNPLTITVLAGQALRENLTTTAADRGVRGPAAGRGSRAGSRAKTRRWAGPGRWPPRCLTGSPTPSPAPSAASSRCCTCSATPSTPTPSASWATPTSPRTTRCPSSPGSPARPRSRCWTGPPPSAC